MSLYLLLFALFLVQEPVSTDAVLLEAYQYHYNLWIIHGLFVGATLLDIVFLYAVGEWLRKRFGENSFAARLAAWARSLSAVAGKYGDYVFLLLWGPAMFPVSPLVAPWLGITFRETLTYLFLGDLIFWYGVEWLIVLGVKFVVPDPLEALYGVVIVSLVIALALRYLRRK